MSKDKPTNRKMKAFEVGEEVMAKWPGSDLWYEAIVESVDHQMKKCVVKYKDGQENGVSFSQMAKPQRFRRRSRSASPSRRLVSGRNRRSRSRSKSPSRNKKPASPRKPSPRKPSPSRAKRVPSQQLRKSEEEEEKPPVSQGKVTRNVTLEARVTRSALRQLEEHGVDTQNIRNELGKGLYNDEDTNSKQRGYEFGGPFGVVFLTVALILLVIASYLYCGKTKCWHFSEIFKKHRIPFPSAKEFLDLRAAAIVYGWIAFQLFLSLLPLGKVVEGLPLKDKTKLTYRLNGFHALIISVVAFAACLYYKLPVVNLVYNKFLAIMTHAIIFSYILGKLVYLKAFLEGTGISDRGRTGNHIYDVFMGRQLNPRISNFDLKFFFELRPGLIGLVLIDLVMAATVYHNQSIDKVPMLLVCMFQIVYVADALWFEGSSLTTPDITKEGFGFMLSFGGLVWVPFMFSLQARFLASNHVTLQPWLVAIILVLNAIGFIIYRVANLQKDLFRQNQRHPAVEHLESMATEVSDKRLLVSGWWGYVRHPNYLGDIIMAISWSLACGFSHAIPYFYPVYLIIFLIHRSYRDEADNRQKYGRSWDEYCKRVPYRIFPNMF